MKNNYLTEKMKCLRFIFITVSLIIIYLPFASAVYNPYPIWCGGDKYYITLGSTDYLYKQIGGIGPSYLLDTASYYMDDLRYTGLCCGSSFYWNQGFQMKKCNAGENCQGTANTLGHADKGFGRVPPETWDDVMSPACMGNDLYYLDNLYHFSAGGNSYYKLYKSFGNYYYKWDLGYSLSQFHLSYGLSMCSNTIYWNSYPGELSFNTLGTTSWDFTHSGIIPGECSIVNQRGRVDCNSYHVCQISGQCLMWGPTINCPNGQITDDSGNCYTPTTLTVEAGKEIEWDNAPQAGILTSNPVGINCGTSCVFQDVNFAAGSTVVITATPVAGYEFSNWANWSDPANCWGFCDSIDENKCTLNMDMHKIAWANFSINLANGTCNQTTNSTPTYTIPLNNYLCSNGTGTNVLINPINFTWNCTGIGIGTNDTCLALRKIDGMCNSTTTSVPASDAPSAPYLCINGTNTNTITYQNNFTWNCSGINTGLNRTCSAKRKIDGICNQTTENTFAYNAPTIPYLCLNGTNTNIITNPINFTWNCTGIGIGTNDTCLELRKLDGICNLTTELQPSLYAPIQPYLCFAGTNTNVITNPTNFSWNCTGINTGNLEECNSPRLVTIVDINLSKDMINPTKSTYIPNKKINTQINIINRVTQTLDDYYLADYRLNNNCGKTGANYDFKADNTACIITLPDNISCDINLDYNFDYFDQPMKYHGCAKISGIWYNSLPGYLQINSTCGDNKTTISAGEECDNGTSYNGILCSPIYGKNCSYCDNDCKILNITGQHCGDLILNTTYEACEINNHCPQIPNKCHNSTHINATNPLCSGCNCINLTSTNYCGNNMLCDPSINQCVAPTTERCYSLGNCSQPDECCYGFTQYHYGYCINSATWATDQQKENDACLCMLSRAPAQKLNGTCINTGDYPCWNTNPAQPRCCGNTIGENWSTTLSTDKIFEDILIEGYCLDGRWLSRNDYNITKYDLWVS